MNKDNSSGIPTYRNFIFDIAGVLLNWDSRPRELLELKGCGANLKEMLNNKIWFELEKGTISREEGFKKIGAMHNIPAATFRNFMEAAVASLVVNSGCVRLLTELKSLEKKLYAVTNTPSEDYSYIRSKFSFWDKFDDVFISGNLGMRKPDHEIFLHILKKHDLKAEETVFIDDTVENVEAARALGITCILFKDNQNCIEQLRLL